MKLKSIKELRNWCKVSKKKNHPEYDSDFVGCEYKDKFGLFNIYHGDKKDIGGFLSTSLKIAEDGQAIYEFLQNASDCKSTHFYAFFNDDYFVAINNGFPFTKEGIDSLLNVSQSTKKDSSQIGRFGIGFKLVHRLVGKDDGIDELLNDYKGPVLFSWSNISDLQSLLQGTQLDYSDSIEGESPYLFKILLTNFPAQVDEEVFDREYNKFVPFERSEFDEMCSFLNQCLENKDISWLNTGTLFFIKLGEGKKKLLDDNYGDLKLGTQYSMNLLRDLSNIYINDEKIEKVCLELETGFVAKDSERFKEINPEYKEADITYAIGYNRLDFKDKKSEQLDCLKKSPNIYKYFPMGDEIHHLSFFIHCDSFSNESNRRKLHHEKRNELIFEEISKLLISKMDEYRENCATKYEQIFANILLCDSTNENTKWLNPCFLDPLFEYVNRYVPTVDGRFVDSELVKIKSTEINIPFDEVGLGDYHWYKWNENHLGGILERRAVDLKIKRWGLMDIIKNSDLDKLNSWIASLDKQQYLDLFKELDHCAKSSSFDAKCLDGIKLYRLHPLRDKLYSEFSDFTFLRKKIVNVKECLITLGMRLTYICIDEYQNLKDKLSLATEKQVFDRIADCLTSNCSLTFEQKRSLFLNFVNEDTKFEGVGETSIKELCLFSNANGEKRYLKELVSSKISVPEWLKDYQLTPIEYFSELDKYLVKEENIYDTIVYPHFEDLKSYINNDNVVEFYQYVAHWYGMNEGNSRLSFQQSDHFIYMGAGQWSSDNYVFTNSAMIQMKSDYEKFSNAVYTSINIPIPPKNILAFLQSAPFKCTDFKYTLQYNSLQSDFSLSNDDVDSILNFCDISGDNFFETFIIEELFSSLFTFCNKNGRCQVIPANNELREFIENYCSDSLVCLPSVLVSERIKSEKGILKGEELYVKVLDCIDCDDYVSELSGLIKYDSAKKKFIEKLSSVVLDINERNSYYDVLSIASEVLSKEDYPTFRGKVKIIDGSKEYSLSDFSSSSLDKFEYCDKTFNLSEILIDEVSNGAILDKFISKVSDLNCDVEKVKLLLGLFNAEIDPTNIFDKLIEKYKKLTTCQQLGFVLNYKSENKYANIGDFELDFESDSSYKISVGACYIKNLPYISTCYVLKMSVFQNLKKYIDLPYYGGQLFLEEPYINDNNEFVCPALDTDSDSKKTALLSFLHSLWRNAFDAFKKVDWSYIGDKSIFDILGFNPSECIVSETYSLEEERLPQYVKEWCRSRLDFLADFGVIMDDSPIILFRRYVVGELSSFDFDNWGLNDWEYKLKSSLGWINGRGISFSDSDKYELLNRVCKKVNSKFVSQEFDVNKALNNGKELDDENYLIWKQESGIKIFVCNGQLPYRTYIDDYEDIIYEFYDDAIKYVCQDNTLYLKGEDDIDALIHQLSYDKNCDYYEYLKQLTASEIQRARELSSELERLRAENEMLKSSQGVINFEGNVNNDDLASDKMAVINEEACNSVLSYLKTNLNYNTDNAERNYSSVLGVLNQNGNSCPLVIKSYKNHNRTFEINPNEWLQLMKDNAELWVYDGNPHLVRFKDLFTEKDDIILRLSSSNFGSAVNKITEFAQFLKYFEKVEFKFSSLNYERYSIAEQMDSYKFFDSKREALPEDGDGNIIDL